MDGHTNIYKKGSVMIITFCCYSIQNLFAILINSVGLSAGQRFNRRFGGCSTVKEDGGSLFINVNP